MVHLLIEVNDKPTLVREDKFLDAGSGESEMEERWKDANEAE